MELLPEDAMPPAGHEETGPIRGWGWGLVSEKPEAGKGMLGGSEEPWVEQGKQPVVEMQVKGTFQLLPGCPGQ